MWHVENRNFGSKSHSWLQSWPRSSFGNRDFSQDLILSGRFRQPDSLNNLGTTYSFLLLVQPYHTPLQSETVSLPPGYAVTLHCMHWPTWQQVGHWTHLPRCLLPPPHSSDEGAHPWLPRLAVDSDPMHPELAALSDPATECLMKHIQHAEFPSSPTPPDILTWSSGNSSPSASNSGRSTNPIKLHCDDGLVIFSRSMKGVTGSPSNFSASLCLKNSCKTTHGLNN